MIVAKKCKNCNSIDASVSGSILVVLEEFDEIVDIMLSNFSKTDLIQIIKDHKMAEEDD